MPAAVQERFPEEHLLLDSLLAYVYFRTGLGFITLFKNSFLQ